jgi:DNA gyrase/topoisomerase IV subunit A
LAALLKWNSILGGGGVAVIVSVLIAKFLPGTTFPLWIAALGGFLSLWLCASFLTAVKYSADDARQLRSDAQTERARYEKEHHEHERDLLQERHEHERKLDKEHHEHEKERDKLEQELRELKKDRGPVTVEAAVRPFTPYQTARCVFIARWPGVPLPLASRVIIAVAEATHERQLGGGFMRPPQLDGKSVITLDELHPDADAILEALLDSRTHDETVKRVRIGPGFDLQNINTASSNTSSNAPTGVNKASPVQSGGTK